MYLFDTNVLSELVRKAPDRRISHRLLAVDRAQRFASEISRFELRGGALRCDDEGALWKRIEALILPDMLWLPIDAAVANRAADISDRLRRSGRPIDLPDLLLAATALAHDLTMVTRNVRHFERVPGLMVENWFDTA
jgi:predicted nucleic acid-binding protein